MGDLNFNNIIKNSPIEVKCPKCNHKITVTFNKIGTSVICPACKSNIELRKSNDFDRSVNSIDKSLKSLNKTLKNFGK